MLQAERAPLSSVEPAEERVQRVGRAELAGSVEGVGLVVQE